MSSANTIRGKLEELQARHSLIGDVRGMGLMQALELVKDRKTKEPAPEATTQVMERARQNGLLIGKGGLYGNTLRLAPMLNTTKPRRRRSHQAPRQIVHRGSGIENQQSVHGACHSFFGKPRFCHFKFNHSRVRRKLLWKSVGFAIVKFNDEAPKSWNIYHTEKKGLLLVRLWKRYLLVDMKEQEAYGNRSANGEQRGEDVEWSPADKPDQPLETPEWKTRDVGSVQLVRFRLGKDGHVLEMQIPLLINGKPAY